MSTRMLRQLVPVAALVLALVLPGHARAQTIPLEVSLDGAISVDAVVTIDQASIQNGQLVVTGSVSGSATVAGISATVSGSVTLTATASCSGGTGRLVLSVTTPTTLTTGSGQATLAPFTVTLAASCGKTPSLSVSTNGLTATLADKSQVSVGSCSVSISGPASSTLGRTACDAKTLLCELADAINSGSVSDATSLLNQVLTSLLI